jgi:hypothetical protein
MKYLQMCADSAKEINDEKASANILSSIGIYHCTKGDPGMGSVCLENAFLEAQKSEDLDLIVPVGYDLTLLYSTRREFAPALEAADKILPVMQTYGQREMFGRAVYVYPMTLGCKGFAMSHLGGTSPGRNS